MPPLRFLLPVDLPPELAFAPLDLLELLEPEPWRAQRALAAAASFARVAADIGRLRPSVFVAFVDALDDEELVPALLLLAPPLLPLPLKSELSRSSRD